MAASDVTGRQVGRYQLEDLLAESGDCALWCAQDPALGRRVAVRTVPRSGPVAGPLRDSARLASRVDDPRLVRVLDVFESSTHLVVVTEWAPGRSWVDVVREGVDPWEAAAVVLEAARALRVAHEGGVAHGRLRPGSLIVDGAGGVRIRGLGVEAAMWGVEPPGDPVEADRRGLGALLYAALTGRWPYGPMDGLRGAPVVGGGIPAPTQVVADVPAALDEVVVRALSTAPVRGRAPYRDLDELGAALVRAAQSMPAARAARTARRRPRWPWRVAGVAGVLAVSAATGLLGWHLITSGSAAWTATPAPSASVLLGARPAASASAQPVTPAVERVLPVLSVRDFDPDGNGEEHPTQVSFANDDDVQTVWTTMLYRSANLSGKSGVGLLVDLGAPRPVSSVDLQLLGSGTDLEIRTSDQAGEGPTDFTVFASAAGAPGKITLRSPRTVEARYVLVWLTKVPGAEDASGFRGGIRELVVKG